jgi:hypothetical protein
MIDCKECGERVDALPIHKCKKAVVTDNSALLCVGDINQGLGDALSVIRVNGHPDGRGLPESFIIEDTRTGRCMTYVYEDT